MGVLLDRLQATRIRLLDLYASPAGIAPRGGIAPAAGQERPA
jgi:hypothetical protein